MSIRLRRGVSYSWYIHIVSILLLKSYTKKNSNLPEDVLHYLLRKPQIFKSIHFQPPPPNRWIGQKKLPKKSEKSGLTTLFQTQVFSLGTIFFGSDSSRIKREASNSPHLYASTLLGAITRSDLTLRYVLYIVESDPKKRIHVILQDSHNKLFSFL